MTARALIVGNTDGIGRALTKVLLDRDWSVSGVSRRTSDLAHPHYRHAVADVAGDPVGANLVGDPGRAAPGRGGLFRRREQAVALGFELLAGDRPLLEEGEQFLQLFSDRRHA